MKLCYLNTRRYNGSGLEGADNFLLKGIHGMPNAGVRIRTWSLESYLKNI